jgi:Putative DNA-binding domain
MFARAVGGGKVIVGEPDSENDSDVDKRLAINAERFGTTVEQAAQLRERFIDGPVDYAVVNGAGEVLSAAGGIPLTIEAKTLTDTFSKGPRIHLAGQPYYVVTVPVTAEGADPVGTIVVVKNISLERRIVRTARTFNAAVAGMSWLITGIAFGIYGYSQRGIRMSCEEAYSRDECQTIEFKSSLRWDHENQERTKVMEGAVIKTVAAFLNTHGGVLLVGVLCANVRCQIANVVAEKTVLVHRSHVSNPYMAARWARSRRSRQAPPCAGVRVVAIASLETKPGPPLPPHTDPAPRALAALGKVQCRWEAAKR